MYYSGWGQEPTALREAGERVTLHDRSRRTSPRRSQWTEAFAVKVCGWTVSRWEFGIP